MKKRIISSTVIAALFISSIGGMAMAAGTPKTINVDASYHVEGGIGAMKTIKSIVSMEITNVTEALDFSLKYDDEGKVAGIDFMDGRKIVAQAPVKITYKGEIDQRGDKLERSPIWVKSLTMTPEQFSQRTGTVSFEAGYYKYNGANLDYDTYYEIREEKGKDFEFIHDSVWDYALSDDMTNITDSITLHKGYYLMGFDTYGSSHFGYIEVTDDGAQPPISSQNEPSDWAVEEIDKAQVAGLVSDSMKDAGWQKATSRLAAAEAMVALIEKASDSTMDKIAIDHGWDLSKNHFSDTDNQAVTFLKYAGITTGVGDNKYDLNGEYTRAQIVTMIGRTAEVFFGVTAKGTNTFSDVPEWAAPYVGYAADSGITQGVGSGLFNPNGTLQNQHTVVFCYRSYLAFTK